MDTYTINKEIIISATPSVVFNMITNPDEITKYFPLDDVISTWEEGSEILYKGVVNNHAFTDYGIIDVIKPPHIFQYTYWSDNHGTQRLPENHLTIKYELTKHNNDTKLILVHSHLQNKDMYKLMNNSVWGNLLASMKSHIESVI